MKVKMKVRLYYFLSNLIKYICLIIAYPFWLMWGLIYFFCIVFFVTDGSVELKFPWEWDWM